MTGKRLPLLAFLICVLRIAASASESQLEVAKVQEGVLSAGQLQSFVMTVNAGDLVQISLDPRGKELVVITYDPAGRRFRGARLGPDPDRFTFIANRAGRYRLEVAGADKSIEGPYAITLEKVVTLAARLEPVKPLAESPRIKALKAAVDAGERGSVDAFWLEVKKRGSPIIEPLPGDDKNMLVTFLWQGAPETHNIFVARLPYAAGAPDDYFMERLGDTDVWYKTVAIDRTARFQYSLAPNAPKLRAISEGIDEDVITMIAAAARPDPLNPKRYRIDKQSVDAPEYQGDSFVEMPAAPAQPWATERPGMAKGRIERHSFKSALLKNEREIGVYLPPGYSNSEKPYALLVVFDESRYLGDQNESALVPTPTILDNLISRQRIPPMVAIFVANAAGARSRELACNPAFSDFLTSEVLPWAHSLYNFTTDPRQAVVGGSSLGGLAAGCAGLHHSETFGNILSQSGSFHWVPQKNGGSSDADSDAERNWVARQFIAKPKQPLRFYLDAGSDEIDLTGGGNSILPANRTLRDVLRAKGYEVYFQEFVGGHDYLSWRGTLADGLIALMGNVTKPTSDSGAKTD